MGSDTKIAHVAIDDLHTEVLPDATQKAFATCLTLDAVLHGWYLAGGTALALQVGHRSSEDLDFFTQDKDFDASFLENALSQHGEWETSHTQEGTLYGVFQGAKVSFIAYPFFVPAAARRKCGAVQMLDMSDIMPMKILAISQRGKKRDFVDMYWYCALNHGSLIDAIRRMTAQFPGRKHNISHLLKSLTYFEDAERDSMPKLHFKADWEEIKAYFRREVPKIATELFDIDKTVST